MHRWTMPRNRKHFINSLVNAFQLGMTAGYAVDHERLSEDEEKFTNNFRLMIDGKVDSLITPDEGDINGQ